MSIDGPTVVVSPLIALQQDQLTTMRVLDPSSVAVNSTCPRPSAPRRSAFARREVEFLLLGPETLADLEVLAALRLDACEVSDRRSNRRKSAPSMPGGFRIAVACRK